MGSSEDHVDQDVGEAVVVEYPSSSLVQSIAIAGLDRTSFDLVFREFEGMEHLDTIEKVYASLESAHDALMSLGAFNAVDIVLDESRDRVDRVTVRVAASEKSMVGINMGTYVQGSEGTVEASCHVRNAMGRAETMSLAVEQGLTPANNTYSLGVSLPRVFRKPYHADIKAQQVFTSKAKWSSYVERLRGVRCSLVDDDGARSFSYELGWRTLSDPSMIASPGVIKHLGESIKSCATFSFASRNTLSSVEVGGIGPSGLFQYVKGSVSGRIAVELSEFADILLDGTAGVIIPNGDIGGISPCDKFSVGGIGPYGLRGFQADGIGPVSVRRRKTNRLTDSLGGTFMCTVLGALRFDVPSPTLAALGVRGQLFIQSGTLTDGPAEGLVAANWRTSVGVGIVWPTNLGVLELNVCRAIKSTEHDHVKTGLQFGITPY